MIIDRLKRLNDLRKRRFFTLKVSLPMPIFNIINIRTFFFENNKEGFKNKMVE